MAKKSKIEIPSRDFITDCMWMSYRYCIGRHTITAAMHAPEMAKFISVNPDIISEDRKKFTAKDIRQEITDRLRWREDVFIEGFVREGGQDAGKLILRHIVKLNLDMTRDWAFEVDLNKENVTSHPVDRKPVTNLLQDMTDLIPWMKLADWLDPNEELTIKFDDGVKTVPGFNYFLVGRDVAERHIICDKYVENPFIDVYVDPDRLIEVNLKQI